MTSWTSWMMLYLQFIFSSLIAWVCSKMTILGFKSSHCEMSGWGAWRITHGLTTESGSKHIYSLWEGFAQRLHSPITRSWWKMKAINSSTLEKLNVTIPELKVVKSTTSDHSKRENYVMDWDGARIVWTEVTNMKGWIWEAGNRENAESRGHIHLDGHNDKSHEMILPGSLHCQRMSGRLTFLRIEV